MQRFSTTGVSQQLSYDSIQSSSQSHDRQTKTFLLWLKYKLAIPHIRLEWKACIRSNGATATRAFAKAFDELKNNYRQLNPLLTTPLPVLDSKVIDFLSFFNLYITMQQLILFEAGYILNFILKPCLEKLQKKSCWKHFKRSTQLEPIKWGKLLSLFRKSWIWIDL